MSAAEDQRPAGGAAGGPRPESELEAEAADQAYFKAIEDYFLLRRGAGLVLSPADWHLARKWRGWGMPVEVVRRGIDDVMARRQARGARGRVSSLRYCQPAVEAVWLERSELAAPGGRESAAVFDPAARLRALAAALPAAFAGGAVAAQMAALAAGDFDAEVVESRLAGIEQRALDAALAALPPAERAALDAAVDGALAAVPGRLPAAELERAREGLARQILRGRLGLPTLSLFSPEAEAEENGAADPPQP